MFESDYGAETADYDPREDAEEREPDDQGEPNDPEEPQGSYWDQVLAGRLVQPATLLASFPHF